MKTTNNTRSSSAKERILATASDLFYRQGFLATGINEVIDKSGVAKATFYNHFPSKELLYEACLEEKKDLELATIRQMIAQENTPRAQLLAILNWLKPWAIETDFRGCAFLHAATEVPDPSKRLRRVGVNLYDEIRKIVKELASNLIASDPARYAHLDADSLSDFYMIAFAAAVSQAEIYHSVSPIEHSITLIERLIGDK